MNFVNKVYSIFKKAQSYQRTLFYQGIKIDKAQSIGIKRGQMIKMIIRQNLRTSKKSIKYDVK